ncbi:MAG: M48 family metallopeptidase [Patescibacteria group bacterium]
MVVYKQVSSNTFKTWILITLFLGLIIGLGWFFSYYYNSPGILIFAVLFSVFSAFFSYWFSDKIVLRLAGAREIAKKSDFPELYRIVENLAIAAGLPMPKLYVIDDPSPNAFAAGRNPKNAVVAVNRGLLEILDKSEVEGVIAHELSHVGNRDILLMTIVVVLVGIVSLLSDWFLRMRFWGLGRSSRDSDSRQQSGLIAIIGLIMMILAPIVGSLIQLAISRKREFLADADAVLITRYPKGLADALRKIALTNVQPRFAHSATSHLYIASPFKEDAKGVGGELPDTPWHVNLFSTHPPIKQRISVLEKMSQ